MNTNDNKPKNYIGYNAKGEATSFVGAKAVDTYRVAMLISTLPLFSKGLQPTRGFTITKALKLATEYTGKPYKRTQWELARADLQEILDKKKSELKHVQEA